MLFKTLYIVLHFTLSAYFVATEPFSAITAGLVATVGAAYYTGLCYVSECCHENSMPADFIKLKTVLHKELYGQHIAKNIIINALKNHWHSKHTQKPLTLSFHGPPGTGKNYVAKFIQEALYTKGGNSQFVHHFMGRIHFPLEKEVNQYQKNIYQWIKGNVTACPRQLFIFDEVDKMPSKILDIIKPIIDYNDHVEKVDYRKSIFIFLSNTGSAAIVDAYLNFWKNGIVRENIKLKDFEKLILNGAFNEEGGFHRSDTIKSNLIDHYIPFLPLELEHVKQCIHNQYQLRNITPSNNQIQDVLEFVEWAPDPENILSKTGCKRISQIVGAMASDDH